MNTVSINGKTYSVPDGYLSVTNGQIYVNGQLIDTTDKIPSDVVIKVEGTLASLSVDNGSVNCQNVNGNIYAKGHVNVNGNVSGRIDTDGHVNVIGKTMPMNDISANINSPGSTGSNFTIDNITINA